MTAVAGAPGRPSRRDVLRGGLAAGAVAAASGLPGPWDGGWLRPPGSRPYPRLPEGTDTLPQIEHVVVVMMENHSYDNRLGTLRRPGADGFPLDRRGRPRVTNPYPDGRRQRAFHMPTGCQLPGHPAQNWVDSHVQYANGRNDGFVRSGSGPVAMGYWDPADQPFYAALASVFPLADRYFAPVLGQTYPNRRYLLAATSFGQVGDDLPTVTTYPPNGTIYDRLDAHGITWKTYYDLTSLPTTLLFPPLFFNNRTKHVSNAEFFTDAAAGSLPNFCIVDPQYEWQSEENPQNIAQGEQFVARVVDALMRGPCWPRSLLIWTYDEHGGYYDHVPPPRAVLPDSIPPAVPGTEVFDGFGRYGFRVPCVVVSPWARRHHVSHTVYDHTSILKVLEAKWNLPAMTYRDANAHSLLDMLDLRRPAFAQPPTLPAPLAATDPAALACSVTGPGVIPPPDSILD
ncbi:MAG TPA: alkaline phosphatase family protein [Rugosimonospora sp.]|nr:alkaline phosphatase family protein [Rugosimonospora sp.]